MKLFLGEYEHVSDDRGRVTLPRKIRQEISGEIVILSRGFDRCIFGFDRESWEREAEKHLEGPLIDQRAREIRRYLFSTAESVDIDRLGRILLPAHLKEYASITKDVMVIGAGDHFEMWEKNAWERQRKNSWSS